MKNTFTKLLSVFLITTSLLACNKDDSNNSGGDLKPLNVTPANLKGAWEVESWLINGQPATSSPNNSPADKLQYEISDTVLTIILSKNNQVTWVASAPYTIQNGRIVTKDEANSSLQDLDILTITATTMRVRPLPQEASNSGELTWNLRRIELSAIVGGPNQGEQEEEGPEGRPGKWREQSIQMQMFTPTRQFIYENVFKTRGSQQTPEAEFLNCSYLGDTKTFQLEMTAFRRESSRSEEHEIEAQLWLIGRDVVFDFSKRKEVVNIDIVSSRREQHPGFVATYHPPRSKKVYFGMTRDSRCTLNLTRHARSVRFEGACRDLDANGDRIEGRSRMIIKGACSLP